MWNDELKSPVRKCLESGLLDSENLSVIYSFSYISQSFDLRPSLTGITERGLSGIAMSHTLTLRKSRTARYFSFCVKLRLE
jgi:hypothetical protein